ncbi:MAG: hypothetical protein D6785_07355, partial [Planctomycetota bacterium]
MKGNEYKILEKVGEEEYLALHLLTEEERRLHLFSEEAVGRIAFLSSALEKLKSLDHPCLAKILDFGQIEWEGRLYYFGATNLGNCQKLDFFLPTLTTEEKYGILQKLFSLLDYLHSQGFVYGEISPFTLYGRRQDSFRLFLSPFYLLPFHSKTYDPCKFHLDYSSPEILGKQPLSVRSDIYSLGLFCFTLFTSMKPLFLRYSLGLEPFPSFEGECIPSEWQKTLKKALSLSLKEGYSSLQEWHQELEIPGFLSNYTFSFTRHESPCFSPLPWKEGLVKLINSSENFISLPLHSHSTLIHLFASYLRGEGQEILWGTGKNLILPMSTMNY